MTSPDAGTGVLVAPRTGTPGPRLPSVNLLSPDTLEHLAVRHVKRRLVAAGLVGALLVGGGWMVQSVRLSSAKSDLATEQKATGPLQSELASLAPVGQFVAGLEGRKQAASRAMAAEVLFSEALTDLTKRTPKNVKLSSISVALTPEVVQANAPAVSPLARAGMDAQGRPVPAAQSGAATGATGGAAAANGTAANASATTPTADAGTDLTADAPAAPVASPASTAVTCNRPDPFRPATIIGCVTIAGTAPNRAAVGAFIENLKTGKIYADPFVTTTTVSGADGSQAVQFAGSVGLTGTLVSGRYADLSWLADPDVLAAAEKLVASGKTAGDRLEEQTQAQADLEKAQAAAAEKAQKAQEAKEKAEAEKAADEARQKLLDSLNKGKTPATNEGQ
jgi:hypothetical protein